MKVISIGTFKGGQSKTFISALLCRKLSESGSKVLAISICGQNNLNEYLGSEIGEKQLFHALDENNIRISILPTKFTNIDFIPNQLTKTKSIDSLLQTITGGENRIKLLLKQVKDEYDYVICDTPPSLNISTVASIIASDYLITPTQLRKESIEGLKSTMEILNDVIELELGHCKYLGIVRSMANVMRDTEAFEQEEYLDKMEWNNLGNLPSSAALRKSLRNFISYDSIKKNHLDQVNQLLTNILKQVRNGN